MRIQRRLLVAGLMLLLVSLSCIASTEGQSSESEEAMATVQTCVGPGGWSEILEYPQCLEPFNVSELEALKDHDFCLASPDCLVAAQSALDTINVKETQTAEALPTLNPAGEADSIEHGSEECANLTLEECTNAGGHVYGILAVGRDTGKCTYYDRPYSEVWREITFGNGQFKLEGYTGVDYDGHTRLAENTYQWVNSTGSTETVTFTLNGHIVVEKSPSGECITDITYTLIE